MSVASDGNTINGYNLTANYFYNATNEGAGVSQINNGPLDYSGTVQTGGISGLSGAITNLGNGFFNLTPAGGAATEYQILGSTSDGRNLVFETYAGNGPDRLVEDPSISYQIPVRHHRPVISITTVTTAIRHLRRA